MADIVECFMVIPSVIVLRFTKEISVKVRSNKFTFSFIHSIYSLTHAILGNVSQNTADVFSALCRSVFLFNSYEKYFVSS